MTIFGNTSTDMHGERVNSDAEEFEAEFETAEESEDADEPVKVVEAQDEDLVWVNAPDVKAYSRLKTPDEVEEIIYKGQDLLARIKELEAENAELKGGSDVSGTQPYSLDPEYMRLAELLKDANYAFESAQVESLRCEADQIEASSNLRKYWESED